MIFKSHNILKARNAALGAAYAAVDAAFKKYRERAVQKFGEEVDKELRYGLKSEEVLTVNEDGTESVEKVVTADISGDYSQYAVIFDESSRQWQKNAEYNKLFLIKAQEHFNDLLKNRGYLFLNEVYQHLDIPRTQAGQVVGWLTKENGGEDGRVDIGLWDIDRDRTRCFINGYERNIILDFNVDGIIFDKIDGIGKKSKLVKEAVNV